jgi:hypothetical protein
MFQNATESVVGLGDGAGRLWAAASHAHQSWIRMLQQTKAR